MKLPTRRRLRTEPLEDRCTPATALGLDATGLNLLRFDTATPGTIQDTIPITGLAVGGATESLVAIDFRPATGDLYALGVNETAVGDDEGRLYTINPTTGAATQVGTGPLSILIADTASAHGFDFNPVVDRIRLVNNADQNLRINPDDASAIADTNLAFASGDVSTGSPDVAAVAYTNNFVGATTTSLIGIDFSRDRIVVQDPPNQGTLTSGGLLNFNTTGAAGFDITAGGEALAVLTGPAAVNSTLVRIDLATGAATTLGGIGEVTTGTLRGFSLVPSDTVRPTVTVEQAAGQADPTNNSPIAFTVTFSEPVFGFDANDVTISGTAGATTAVVSGAGPVYTVTVSGMTNAGTVIVTIPAAAAADAVGNPNEASTSTDNSVTFMAGDTTNPSVTINQAADQPDPTNVAPVRFTVVFSEPVTGFTDQDVVLEGEGAVGTTVTVAGSGSTYTVSVAGFTRAGPVRASIPAGAAIDAAANASLASTSTDNLVVFNFGKGIGLGGTITREWAVGADAGGSSVVRFFNPDGSERFTVTPFPGLTGGIRVAAADFSGDGIADIAVGTGPGSASLVQIYDGVSKALLFEIQPFEASFVGGVYVAAGDLSGDGVPDLVISPDRTGGPRVRVFDGANKFAQIIDFFGIEDVNFRGGARVAVGDISGDGVGDLIVAAGFTGGPRVAVFDGSKLGNAIETDVGLQPPKLFGDFFMFENTLRNGVFVTSGDLNGDLFAEVIAGGGPGGGPRVFALSGKDLTAQVANPAQLANFFAGDATNRGGVRLAAKDLDGDLLADLITGDGPSDDESLVRGYLGKNIPPNGDPTELAFSFDPYDAFTGGVFVG